MIVATMRSLTWELGDSTKPVPPSMKMKMAIEAAPIIRSLRRPNESTVKPTNEIVQIPTTEEMTLSKKGRGMFCSWKNTTEYWETKA